MFTNCSGPCGCCDCAGFCLAGHGDDDYSPASASTIIERLNKNQYPSDRKQMIEFLSNRYKIDYVQGMLLGLNERS